MPSDVRYSAIYCIRFDFGLPLEDIFPPDDVHPKLKFLMEQAYNSIKGRTYSIHDILKYQRGTLQDRLNVKESLLANEQLEGDEIPAGVFLWLIRHFIGQLPVPIFPNFQSYIWKDMALSCKDFIFQQYYDDDSISLDQILVEHIRTLPLPNINFLGVFLNFLRQLCIRPYSLKLDKESTLSLIKYFTSSLFERPFRPGFVTKDEKCFYPLLFYLIVRWPFIAETLKTQRYQKESSVYDTDTSSETLNKRNYIIEKKMNKIIQTDLTSLEIEQLCKHEDDRSDDMSYLKDCGCQTDDNETSHSIEVSNQESFMHKHDRARMCCCAYGSHYEKIADILSATEDFKLKEDDINIDISNNREEIEEQELSIVEYESIGGQQQSPMQEIPIDSNGKLFGEISKYGWGINRPVHDESYMYDDYDTFNTENFNRITAGEVDKGKDERDSGTSISNSKSMSLISFEGKKNLMEKISKIGWCYSPRDSRHSSQTYTSQGYERSDEKSDEKEYLKSDQKEFLKTYFDEEEQKNLHCHLRAKSENDNKSDRKSDRRHFKKLRKITSMLNILRYIPSSVSIKRSTNELMSSNIKYKKMLKKCRTL